MIVNLLSGMDRRQWTPVLVHHGEPGLNELIERTRELGVQTVELPRADEKRSIRRLLRESRPTIFHAHLNWAFACAEALVTARLARTSRVIATQQLFLPISSRRGILRHKLLSTAVDRYIAVSHHMAGMLREVCVFGRRKVRVVHNGIALTRFERPNADVRAKIAGENGRPVIMTLARLARQKGIEELIDAASGVPEAVFLVAGEGPERGVLEERVRVRGLGNRFRFLGHRRDVPELLASCDVFVLPSLYEGLPVSVLEAMASGKPVVATRVGGTDEAVRDGVTGLLVPPSDSRALAEAIRLLLSDRSLALRLAACAREQVRREFSAEKVAADTTQIYEELVA